MAFSPLMQCYKNSSRFVVVSTERQPVAGSAAPPAGGNGRAKGSSESSTSSDQPRTPLSPVAAAEPNNANGQPDEERPTIASQVSSPSTKSAGRSPLSSPGRSAVLVDRENATPSAVQMGEYSFEEYRLRYLQE